MRKPILLILPLLLLACGVMAVPTIPLGTPTPSAAAEKSLTPAKKQGQISTGTAQPCVGTVSAAKTLNLRVSPSTSAAADSHGLSHGDTVTILDRAAGWLYVETDDGRRGWVKMEYIETECE